MAHTIRPHLVGFQASANGISMQGTKGSAHGVSRSKVKDDRRKDLEKIVLDNTGCFTIHLCYIHVNMPRPTQEDSDKTELANWVQISGLFAEGIQQLLAIPKDFPLLDPTTIEFP